MKREFTRKETRLIHEIMDKPLNLFFVQAFESKLPVDGEAVQYALEVFVAYAITGKREYDTDIDDQRTLDVMFKRLKERIYSFREAKVNQLKKEKRFPKQ